jgi:flagellar motility protein MotE (MotC chaperone)
MRFEPASAKRRRRSALACGALAPFLCLSAQATESATERPAPGAALKAEHEYCANIAAAAEELRLERRRKELAELEKEVAARLLALEARQNELRATLDRLDTFERKANDSLVGLYSGMKPEAAAAQFAQLDDDVAAALMLSMKTKVSSLILAEMEAARGAALVKMISDLRKSRPGKKP